MSLRTRPRSRPTTTPRQSRTRLGVQCLEGREVPSAVFDSALSVGNATDTSYLYGVAADAAGNSYLTGFFAGTVDFDPAHALPGNADVLTSRGGSDAFVAKYAPDGSLAWACRMGSADTASGAYDRGGKIAVDAAGNVYVVGTFSGTADFGPFTRTSAGLHDPYAVKLDAAGTVKWVTSWGTANDEEGWGVGVDAAGNAYATSYDYGVSSSSAHVLKFGPTGGTVWDDRFVTNGPATSTLAVDAAGNTYLAGTFKGATDFDPSPRVVRSVDAGASTSAFVLKLTTAGAFAWVSPFVGRSAGSAVGSSSAQSVAVDGSGNVMVGGNFAGSGLVDFDPGAGTHTLPDGGGFVAKLSGSSGGLVWADALAGSATVRGLAVDAAGSVYATGNFYGTTDFDPGAGVLSRTPPRGSAFVLKLDAGGGLGWAETFEGSSGGSVGFGVAVDGAGEVYLAGSYTGTVDFDPDPGVAYDLTTPGTTSNIFLLRLRQN